jgi:hypothetical protein
MGLWRAGALQQQSGSDVIGPLRRAGIEHYVGLDVSQEQTSICVVDGSGKTLWQGKCASTPEVMAATIRERAPGIVRIGLESGPLARKLLVALWRYVTTGLVPEGARLKPRAA